jgi:DNA-binding response OmpR family regulator
MAILIVEDDQDIASLLCRAFEMEGYEAESVHTGADAVDTAGRRAYDTIVLDVILPGMSGIEVCRRLRAAGPNMHSSIIMLSARDTVPDRVEGLSAGADDYMTKPFAFEELLARVRAQKRQWVPQPPLAPDRKRICAGLTMTPKLRKIEANNRRVVLTEREFELLELFVRHEGDTLSRTQIANALWGDQRGVSGNLVDVYVGYLRRKLDEVGKGRTRPVIRTVRGIGYVLTANGM